MCRVIKSIDRTTDYMLLLFFLILALLGAYTMYDSMLIYYAAGGDGFRAFRPNVVDGEADGWDMNALSEDVVAWLTVDDTAIDYPVMQGIDNNEYLNKDPYGEFSLAGSLFLDARNASDFSDSYSLIYGHHMEYGKMFGALDYFEDQEYFNSHRTATLTVSDQVYPIRFFACIEADASVKEIFEPTEAVGTLEYVRQNALIFYEPEGERLIALSTCKFPQTTARVIVFGVLKDE